MADFNWSPNKKNVCFRDNYCKNTKEYSEVFVRKINAPGRDTGAF